MKLFFDTSAFIKLFIEERGSVKIKELVDDYRNELFGLHLIKLESLNAEDNWHFVCADGRLCIIAKSLGYEVINPVDK